MPIGPSSTRERPAESSSDNGFAHLFDHRTPVCPAWRGRRPPPSSSMCNMPPPPVSEFLSSYLNSQHPSLLTSPYFNGTSALRFLLSGEHLFISFFFIACGAALFTAICASPWRISSGGSFRHGWTTQRHGNAHESERTDAGESPAHEVVAASVRFHRDYIVNWPEYPHVTHSVANSVDRVAVTFAPPYPLSSTASPPPRPASLSHPLRSVDG